MDRRRYLRLLATGTTGAVAGCAALSEPAGEGSEVEIIPTNATDRRVTVTVGVYTGDWERLLEHTYTLPPDHADESQGVENRVGYVLVSFDGLTVRERYDPDDDLDCYRDGEDVGIQLHADRVDFYYNC